MTPRPALWFAGPLLLLLLAGGIAAGLLHAPVERTDAAVAGCELARLGEDRPLTDAERACFERRGLSFATR